MDKIYQLINDFIKTLDNYSFSEFSSEKLSSINKAYNDICIKLLQEKTLSDEIKQLISDENYTQIQDEKLKKLSKYSDFKKDLTKYYKKELEKKNPKQIFRMISQAISFDIENIILIKSISSNFKKNKLYEELIKLYKIGFMTTSEPSYFEDLADVLFLQGKYNECIDNYLKVAEFNLESKRLYKKLIKVFKIQNDTESIKACELRIAQLEEEKNAK